MYPKEPARELHAGKYAGSDPCLQYNRVIAPWFVMATTTDA